jgi:hypothetical protein
MSTTVGAMRIIVGCALALIGSLTAEPSAATPDKAAYELQMQCGRDAREWFTYARRSGQLSPKAGIISSQFKNHYNARLNKCFVLATSAVQDPVYPQAVNTRFELFDISENVTVAQLQTMTDATGPKPLVDQVIVCGIEQKYCGDGFSATQWRVVIRPYMEE